jgi:flavodoxin I
MTTIGLFYGSTDGTTARIAAQIEAMIAATGRLTVHLNDVAEFYLDELAEYDYLILGVPTWNIGQLQEDWASALDELDELDLSGTSAAVFGLGDQASYPETFVDAMFFVADCVQSRGARLVGRWPTAGYSFSTSWAVVDGDFLGLVLDEHNQPELTEARLAHWLAVVLAEFGI